MSKNHIGDWLQIDDRFKVSDLNFLKLKLAKKAQQKNKKPESKIDKTQDEVTQNGLEDESEEGSEESEAV